MRAAELVSAARVLVLGNNPHVMQTVTLTARFDGQQILLDEPYQLEANTPLMITILPKPVDEQAAWQQLAAQNLARAYEVQEVEYTIADLREPNPEYRAS